MTDSAATDLARADELIGRALPASPRYALAHIVKGDVMRAQNRCEEAILQYESALALNPNLPGVLNGLGLCKLSAGSIDGVIPLVEQAIRLSPRDPQIGTWYGSIGMVHLLHSRTDEAIVWLEKGRSAGPAKPFIRAESRRRLCARRRLGPRRHRARRSPKAERRRFFFEHREDQGRGIMEVAVAEDPRLVGRHLFRWPALGRPAGVMTAARLARYAVDHCPPIIGILKRHRSRNA
jgi:tetratricopeptide (TPR) repeat protein